MRKRYLKQVIGILIILIVLILTACGNKNSDTANDESDASLIDRVAEKVTGDKSISNHNNGTESNRSGTEDDTADIEPERTYRSVDEILKIINGEAVDERAVPDVMSTPDSVVVDEENTYSPETKTVIISEDTWSNPPTEKVEFWDWKSEMTEEELAEWEAMGSGDFDEEIAELEKEMAEMQGQYGADASGGTDGSGSGENEDSDQMNPSDIDMDEIQKQIDDAMKQLEGMDLPPGYEQYLPDGLDLNQLLGK